MTVERRKSNWDLSKGESMLQAIGHARLALCITDPTLPDNPIVYANLAFTELTGYEPDEVIGRNCRFLQGEETTPESVAAVRGIIEHQIVDTVEIVNYRKDGSTFLNALQIGPILDDNGKLVFFFGSQLDISARRQFETEARDLAKAELVHRLTNITNVMSAIIRLTAREEEDAAEFGRTLAQRLSALGEFHINTILNTGTDEPTLSDLVRAILEAYAPLGSEQISLSGPALVLPFSLRSTLTLVLNEVATNAVKHGALGSETGVVDVGWTVEDRDGDRQVRLTWREINGPEVREPRQQSGSKMIAQVLAAMGGQIGYEWSASGLIATMEFTVPT